jgi:beta-lysine 5,6-aminomutase beta subunit
MTLLLGGPRVDHKLALELGFDAGFGPGTKPSDVANFIVHQVLQRLGKEAKGAHYEGEPT